jgi:hypothetical protein
LIIETKGVGPRPVLVHGSVEPGWPQSESQLPLADRFTLVLVVRSGYPPHPPVARTDFEQEAHELVDVLEPGDHLLSGS